MRGVLFTIDAMIALLIVAATVPLVISFYTSADPSNQALSSEADSTIGTLSELTVRNVLKEPVIHDLYNQSIISDSDLDRPVMDIIIEMWASNDTANLTRAQNITKSLLGTVVPSNYQLALSLENETFYNTGGFALQTSAVGRRVASGFMKGRSSSGYIASVFLTSIGGRSANSYYYFGGFVGEGNISVYMNNIPNGSTITSLYMELDVGSNFTFLVNNQNCGTYNITTGLFNATINSSCISFIQPGAQNTFNFTFNTNVTTNYIGGGYMRVSYTTNQLLPIDMNTTRVAFPGINGIINYFDSFYANGNISTMELRMHFVNNYTTFVNVGNTTIFVSAGNASGANATVTNAQLLALLNYTNLSMKTVPLRIGLAVSNQTQLGDGNADVILITDTSGSMNYNFTCDSGCPNGVTRNCTNPSLYNLSTSRISLAKCLDTDFVDIILNNTGNRVGLVAFSTDATDYVDLTSNATLLHDSINSYSSSGSTCISCAINEAYSILLAHNDTGRKRFVVTMTDGVANVRAVNTCNDLYSETYNNITFAGSGTGQIFTRNSTSWNPFALPSSNTIYDMKSLNSTFALAVGSSGRILKWNGSSWSNMTSPTSNTIYGVDIYNGTYALAVDSSGRVLRWNGTSWSINATIANSPTLYSVSILNQTYAFIAGVRSNTGRIYNTTNGGSVWSLNYSSGTAYRGIIFFNTTLAFAVGNDGIISQWNSTKWVDISSPVADDIYRIRKFNSTLMYAVGGYNGNSVIIKFNGTNWTSVYDMPADSLQDVAILNNTSYAVGQGATLIEYNSTWNQTFNMPAAYQGNLTTGTTCTADIDACTQPNSYPALNANYSSCRVHGGFNATVHSIGFGPVATCSFASNTLMAIANCGNGSYYSSSNTSQLQIIYSTLAQNIIAQSYSNQTVYIQGNFSSLLYPDSYLEINYTRNSSTPYQEISTDVETDKFDCNKTLFVPSQFTIQDMRVTSYSGPLWTTIAAVNNSMTRGAWNNTFMLSSFGKQFQMLGDPFDVNIPIGMISPGQNNSIAVYLGENSTNQQSSCPQNSTIIYTAFFKASVPYGLVFSGLSGGVVRVYYDINHDGIPDGYTDLVYGSSLPNFNATVRTVDQLNATGNALDDALLRLFQSLDYTPTGSGPAGSSSNPIDVELNGVDIQTTDVGNIPFQWGPIDIRLDVKV